MIKSDQSAKILGYYLFTAFCSVLFFHHFCSFSVPHDTHYADEKILDIIHKQQETLIVSKPSTKTEDEMKQRLLEQYSHVSDNEERLVL